MIVLDTNVISELMRPRPAPAVLTWFGRHPAASLFTTALTEAEIRYGVELLPEGRRRAALTAAVDELFADDFRGRVLVFDGPAARRFAHIAARRRHSGRPIAQIDAQIAAIASSRGAAVATRNVVDFEGCGVEVVDPFAG